MASDLPSPSYEAARLDGVIAILEAQRETLRESGLDWPKSEAWIADQLEKAHAARAEHTESDDPSGTRGGAVDVTGNPHARGGVLYDMTNAVLFGEMNVSVVDMQSGGRRTGVAIAMEMEGRVNKTDRQSRTLYVFGADGAAAIITELIALVGRDGGPLAEEFAAAFAERTDSLQQRGMDRPG